MSGWLVRDKETGRYAGRRSGLNAPRPWVEAPEKALIFPTKMEAEAYAEGRGYEVIRAKGYGHEQDQA